jgi:hypothetical protein
LALGAGAAAASAAIAMLVGGSTNGGGSSSGHASYDPYAQSYVRTIVPTMIMRNSVGDDISTAELESAISSNEYEYSAEEFDDIQLAYSIARGYTGAGTTIAVFDTGLGTFINERGREETQG